MTAALQTRPPLPTDSDDRLCDLLALHFHLRHGSAYWLGRQERLGWNVRDRVRSLDDLWLLGPMPLDDLRRHPAAVLHPESLPRDRWTASSSARRRVPAASRGRRRTATTSFRRRS